MSNSVVTGKVRFSYTHVFEPRQTLGGDEKYSVTLLIPKSEVDTYNKIMLEMNKVLEESIVSKFGGQRPANPRFPLYDGDGLRQSGEEFGEECKGHWVITANSTGQPEVVDSRGSKIINKTEFYSGCYGHASIRFFAYNSSGNKGIGCGLNSVMKTEDGQPLSGRTSAKEDFAHLLGVQQPEQSQYVQQQPIQPFQQAVNPITGQPISGQPMQPVQPQQNMNVWGVNN